MTCKTPSGFRNVSVCAGQAGESKQGIQEMLEAEMLLAETTQLHFHLLLDILKICT